MRTTIDVYTRFEPVDVIIAVVLGFVNTFVCNRLRLTIDLVSLSISDWYSLFIAFFHRSAFGLCSAWQRLVRILRYVGRDCMWMLIFVNRRRSSALAFVAIHCSSFVVAISSCMILLKRDLLKQCIFEATIRLSASWRYRVCCLHIGVYIETIIVTNTEMGMCFPVKPVIRVILKSDNFSVIFHIFHVFRYRLTLMFSKLLLKLCERDNSLAIAVRARSTYLCYSLCAQWENQDKKM